MLLELTKKHYATHFPVWFQTMWTLVKWFFMLLRGPMGADEDISSSSCYLFIYITVGDHPS